MNLRSCKNRQIVSDIELVSLRRHFTSLATLVEVQCLDSLVKSNLDVTRGRDCTLMGE